MDDLPPLTPLTRKDTAGTPLTRKQIVGRLVVAVLIWLTANVLVFVAASFLVFVLLSSLGVAQDDQAFSLAILCAIPLALTVSGLLAGRRIYSIATNRYH